MEKYNNEYFFTGIHAQKVKDLTDADKGIFQRNVDVFLSAPLIGFVFGKKSDKNNDSTINRVAINAQQMISNKKEALFNYRLIMLLDGENENNEAKRIKKAFEEYFDPLEKDENLFESYIRGGIDILHERIISSANSSEDYIFKLYEFLSDFEKNSEKIKSYKGLDILALAQD